MTASPRILPLVLSSILFSMPLLAADYPMTASEQADTEHDREVSETKGVFSGLVIGALAGGPAGAILSAAGGGWIGNKLHEAKQSRQLKNTLAQREAELAELLAVNEELQQQAISSASELQEYRLIASTSDKYQPYTNCCSDTAITLHFRTASSQLEQHYLEQLEEFARFATLVPDATVEITGHADRRGASSANLALSQKRVKSVEQALRGFGLEHMKFRTRASGEKQPLSATDTFENNFFDRRVQVRLLPEQAELLTRQ